MIERSQRCHHSPDKTYASPPQEQWIWRNGLLVRVKSRIEVLTKKVTILMLNKKKERCSGGQLQQLHRESRQCWLSIPQGGFLKNKTNQIFSDTNDKWNWLNTHATSTGHDGPQYWADRLLQQVRLSNSSVSETSLIFYFQPDGQCEYSRPFWLPLHLFLRIRALFQRVPLWNLPEGGWKDCPPPTCLWHCLQRHQEDPGVHQQQHHQLYCLKKYSCRITLLWIYFW